MELIREKVTLHPVVHDETLLSSKPHRESRMEHVHSDIFVMEEGGVGVKE